MFNDYREFTEKLNFVPLRIECDLAEEVVNVNGIHFDAILSYAVVEKQTQGDMVSGSEYVRVPLPLCAHWENQSGVPLWASTDLQPKEDVTTSTRYWHRRSLEPVMSRKNLRKTAGPYKERRVPMPTIVNATLVADVIGNADEIARLLKPITSIGKKRTGFVIAWRIYQIKSFTMIDDEGNARRPIPVMSLESWELNRASAIGYSPPYWHPATRQMCIPSGAKV